MRHSRWYRISSDILLMLLTFSTKHNEYACLSLYVCCMCTFVCPHTHTHSMYIHIKAMHIQYTHTLKERMRLYMWYRIFQWYFICVFQHCPTFNKITLMQMDNMTTIQISLGRFLAIKDSNKTFWKRLCLIYRWIKIELSHNWFYDFNNIIRTFTLILHLGIIDWLWQTLKLIPVRN